MQPENGFYIQTIQAWADHEYASRAFSLAPGRGCLVLTAFAIDGPPVRIGDSNISLQQARGYQAAFAAFERANPEFTKDLEQQELDRHGIECAAKPGFRAAFFAIHYLGAEPQLHFRLTRVAPITVLVDGPARGNLSELQEVYAEAWNQYLERHNGIDPCAPQVREPTPIGNETAEELRHRKPRGGGLSMQDEIARNLAQNQQRLAALANRR